MHLSPVPGEAHPTGGDVLDGSESQLLLEKIVAAGAWQRPVKQLASHTTTGIISTRRDY